MAKRELIDKQDLLQSLDNFDWQELYLPIHSKDNVIDDVPTITEQEIVKPYLAKLQSKMKERDEDNGGEPYNTIDKGYHLACEHLYKEIDNLLSEQGDTEDG